jgi:hypothetical protein
LSPPRRQQRIVQETQSHVSSASNPAPSAAAHGCFVSTTSDHHVTSSQEDELLGEWGTMGAGEAAGDKASDQVKSDDFNQQPSPYSQSHVHSQQHQLQQQGHQGNKPQRQGFVTSPVIRRHFVVPQTQAAAVSRVNVNTIVDDETVCCCCLSYHREFQFCFRF